MLRKIDAMHERFGMLPDLRCESCSNLIQGEYHDRHYRKCTVYGETRSEATDWRKKYVACGMYNKEWTGHRNVIELRNRDKAQYEPCDGQMKMEVHGGQEDS